MNWLKWCVYPGYGMWFRVFGYGLHFSRVSQAIPLLGDRYAIKAFGWRIKVLR